MQSIKKQLEPKKFKEAELHQSAGILDDYKTSKVMLTKEIEMQKSNSTTMVTNLNSDMVDGKHLAEIDHTAILNIGTNTHAQIDNIHASRMRATRGTAQSFASGAYTIVQYDTEQFDNLGEYDNATNYRFTAKEAGYYSVSASLLSNGVAWDVGEQFQIGIYKNGAGYSWGFREKVDAAVTIFLHSTLNDIIYLAVNDYIDIRAYHTQGGAINCHTDAAYNYFSVHRLS